MVESMTFRWIIALALFAAGGGPVVRAQDPDGDTWYYERIASQDRPPLPGEVVPDSWQDSWNPLVRRFRREIGIRLEMERELPRLRFELQGDRSNKFALFRCLEAEGEGAYFITWTQEEAAPVDDVFLLPTRIPQADGTIRTLGFPERSRLELSASGRFENDARSFPVAAAEEGETAGFPVRVRVDGGDVRAWRWVVEAPFAPYGIGYLAVSEIFVLSGETNIAPRGRLDWSPAFLPDRSMAPDFLQDEKTPLGLPVIREKTEVLGYHSEIKEQTGRDEEWIELSWAVPQEVESIRLIPTQQRVLPHTETFGFPLAHRTDFFREGEKLGSRAVRYAIDPGQNVVTVAGFPGQKIDRVRWTATELWQRRNSRFLSLAEIEVRGVQGRNLASDAVLKVSSRGVENAIWNPEALTDGLASEGRLIAAGEWLRGLDEAMMLRKERLAFSTSRERAIRGTNRVLLAVGMIGMAALAFAAALSAWRVRRRAQGESLEFRRQLAADLHDDLGGNLGSIVLLAGQAQGDFREGSAASSDLDRIVALARESRHQLRTILEVSDEERIDLLDVDTFVSRLRLTVRDFFGEDHGYFTIPDDDGRTIRSLSGKQRADLLLFCKEALHNLTQHGDATRVLVQLESAGGGVLFKMEDDSTVPPARDGLLVSKSLRRRAQRLAKKVSVARLEAGPGNLLILEIPVKTVS